jgi:CBS domain-containing protein
MEGERNMDDNVTRRSETAPGSVAPLVTEIMTAGVPPISPDDSVARVAKLMVDFDVAGLAVVENGEIIGIITESDIIAREADVEAPTMVPFLDAIFVADAGRLYEEEVRRALATNARMLMSSPVISIRSDATLNEVASVMLDRDVHPLPVVNADGHYIGIVSRKDLVRVIAELENQAS